MPTYYIDLENESYIIDKTVLEPYFPLMKSDAERACLALIWISGCRIIEALQLSKDHIIERDNDIIIHLHTAKRRKAYRRTLMISKQTPLLNILLNYAKNCSTNLLFNFSKRTLERRILNANKAIHKDATSKYIIAHQLRHSRASYFVIETRADVWEMQSWFGWKSIAPAQSYVHKVSAERLKDKIR